MNCPKCGDSEPMVIDSRQKPYGIRRRRECLVCGHRYSTVEISIDRYNFLKEAEILILNAKEVKEEIEN